jgi:hypothetical protein
MTTRLPLALEDLRIATPCRADWDEMSGDDRVRFCGRCEKNVYNVSALSRAEAEALVREREGRVCLRLYRRSDGTVITSDCPVGVRRQRLGARVWASISGMATSAALLVGLWSGRARADLAAPDKKPTQTQPTKGTATPPDKHVLMGKVAVGTTTPPKDPPSKKKVVHMAVLGEPVMGDIASP